MRTSITAVIFGLLVFLLPFAVVAENSTKIPGYTIHHNALTTDQLSPEIASFYHIRRSKNRAMLNVSVVKDVEGSTGVSVPAFVRAKVQNLRGQIRYIPMREVREDNAIYYIGDFRVVNQDNLSFELEVTPVGERRAHVAKLTQQFFTE